MARPPRRFRRSLRRPNQNPHPRNHRFPDPLCQVDCPRNRFRRWWFRQPGALQRQHHQSSNPLGSLLRRQHRQLDHRTPPPRVPRRSRRLRRPKRRLPSRNRPKRRLPSRNRPKRRLPSRNPSRHPSRHPDFPPLGRQDPPHRRGWRNQQQRPTATRNPEQATWISTSEPPRHPGAAETNPGRDAAGSSRRFAGTGQKQHPAGCSQHPSGNEAHRR